MTEVPLVLATGAQALLPDPSPRLEAAYREVAQRMTGLPFVNPALRVQAVGFAPWNGHWLGVLVTPWFMNLVLLPRDPGQWQPLPVRAKHSHRFPAGTYEFIGADDPLLGGHQTCSLFSPMQDFDSHDTACLVAKLAREALFDPAHAERPEFPRADLSPVGVADAPQRDGPAGAAGPALSKRDFLRGRLGGAPDADRR